MSSPLCGPIRSLASMLPPLSVSLAIDARRGWRLVTNQTLPATCRRAASVQRTVQILAQSRSYCGLRTPRARQHTKPWHNGRHFWRGAREKVSQQCSGPIQLYLEDLYIGQRFTSGVHHMDAARIKSFAAEFDPQPFHLDEVAARSTIFKGVVCKRFAHACCLYAALSDRGPP